MNTTTTNHGREFWFLPHQAHSERPAPRAPRYSEPVQPEPESEDFALLCDTVDASSALAGQVLKPSAITQIAHAVLHLLGVAKPPAAPAITRATGDLSNP